MTTGQGVISTLKSALKCGGKCDCCASLQAQIDALRNQVLMKSERPALVNESVNLAVPVAVGLVISNVTPKIAATQATAAAAAATASGAAAGVAKLSPLLGLIGAIGSILSLLGLPAIVNLLGSRIDAVESLIASVDAGLSRAIGLIGVADQKADQALTRAFIP
ncbi:MAG: hypothetical protein ACKPGB_02655, partial [Dolichospermum sp.]